MKFSISINQKAAIDSGLSLDIVDLAIFDFIKDFVLTGACRKVVDEYGEWFWISNKIIIEQMPVLGITTEKGMRKHINNLCSEGVLERHPDCVSAKKSLYKLGNKFEGLLFTGNDCSEFTGNKCSGSLGTNVPGYQEQSFRVTRNNRSQYNNIKDNNIKDNNIEDNRESTHTRENDDNLLFDDRTINAAAAAEKEKRKKKKESASLRLFRESETAGLVTYSGGVPDASRLFAEFSAEKYKGVDLLYYYNTVADWSDSANKKRTARGWLATIRQFIEGDREKGKLRMLEGADFNWDAAIDYLKMGRI